MREKYTIKNNMVENKIIKDGSVGGEVVQSSYHAGHRGRLRQRLLASGKGELPDYEILEMILFSSHPRGDVKPLAKELIKRFGSLVKVLNASSENLTSVKGVNEAAIAQFRAVQEAAERLLKGDVVDRPILQSWKALIDYCRASMGYLKKEQFRILFLDRKNMLISDELQEAGTVDQTPVYPREVVKRALQLEVSSIIMVHNHPSGDLAPSKADVAVTKKILVALETVGIVLHDHVIVSSKGHYSFKSHRLL